MHLEMIVSSMFFFLTCRLQFVLPAVVLLLLIPCLFVLPSDSPARFSLGL